MFPVIISAPRKTMFFARDDDDKFNIDLEKVNSGNFSPLKLHRVSFFLDVAHDSMSPMGFGYDGALLLAKSPSMNTAQKSLDRFNEFKSALLLGGLALDASTESMLGAGELLETGYFRYHSAFGAEAEIAHALQEGGAGSILNMNLLGAPLVREAAVRAAFAKGQPLTSKLHRLNSAFLIQSVASFVHGETRSSLIFGWVACEQIVEHLWYSVFLKDEKYYVADFRRRSLEKVNNVAQKLDTLFQSGILPSNVYEDAFFARKARNDFAHKGGEVSSGDVKHCLGALFAMISIVASHESIDFDYLSILEHLFEPDNQKKYPHGYRFVGRAADVSWEGVKYWRSLYPIPGDDLWEDKGEKIDGHSVAVVKS